MKVEQFIELLQEFPKDWEVMVDEGRGGDAGISTSSKDGTVWIEIVD